MKNPWFRLYAEFAFDPKIQSMNETFQRRFIMLLCLKCNDDLEKLDEDEIKSALRIDDEESKKTKELFVKKGFINESWQILKWDKRQFLSDNSTDRVKKHRQKRKEKGLPMQDWINPKTRKDILDKHGKTCVYCGSKDDPTIDHKTPTCRGGSNGENNLQVACRMCNADKRHMTHDEYLNWPGRVTFQKRPQSTDTDTDTDIKNKKINKKKFDFVSFRPDWIPDKLWLSFLENRKFKKLQNSELALTTIVRAIKKAVDAGYSVESCISQFVTSGWKRFNVDWMKDDSSQIQPRTVREALIVARDQMAGEVLKQQRETKYDESTDPHETVDEEVSRHRANLPQLPLS